MAKPTVIQVFKSVLAAFAGVQSKQNREVDFTEGKVSHYIVAGIIVTAAFILMLIWVVSKVLGS